MITSFSHYDKKLTPVTYETLTLEEAKKLSGHTLFCLVSDGRVGTRLGIARAKVTSVHVWKTRPGNADIHMKYGLYDYFVAKYTDGQPTGQIRLVKEITHE
jgi:hypothetical protein